MQLHPRFMFLFLQTDCDFVLCSQTYDGAVGDISITYKRSKHVEFTLPFTEGGINMVMKKTTGDRWFFLKPLSDELWLSSIALFMFTGLAIWILEHRFNSAYRGSLAEHAGMIFYFPFMSLVYAQSEFSFLRLQSFPMPYFWSDLYVMIYVHYRGTDSEQLLSIGHGCLGVCCHDTGFNLHSKPFC